MMRAAENHGHEVYAIDAATLGWRRPDGDHAGGVLRRGAAPALRPDDHDWYRETGREWLPLTRFDAVIMRKDPPFDFEYLTATWLLERAEADGVASSTGRAPARPFRKAGDHRICPIFTARPWFRDMGQLQHSSTSSATSSSSRSTAWAAARFSASIATTRTAM
jgi:hypothetical protein